MTPGSAGAMVAVALGALVALLMRAMPAPRTLALAPAPTNRWRRSWRVWLLAWRRHPCSPTEDDIASWCEHAAGRVRSGHSLPVAIAEAGSAVPAAAAVFAPVTHALARGRPLTDAVGVLDGDPCRPVGIVRAVLGSCAELGGPAAAPLERAAATLRARSAERAERRAASAQAQLSARVLTLLPVGTLALLAFAEASVRGALRTPAGLMCVVTGGACNIAGWWWMRRIVHGRSVT
ncbi:MAG: type II secretion system F family protein [Acidimicrobiia bacterium]|nr:type II secretion system F family protein [Acidimicrobiia bacterium]